MNRHAIFIYLLVTTSLVLLSCDSNEVENLPESNFGFAYLPIEEGIINEYVYDSITYDSDGTDIDTLHGYIQEEIAEPITFGNGDEGFKLMKYWKRNLNDQYVLTDVESIRKTETQVIRSEENLEFIKLVFPNLEGTRWDGNILFDEFVSELFLGDPIQKYLGWNYRVTKRDTVLVGINQTFDNVIHVEHKDESEFTTRRFSKEIFAEGIGMVEKSMIILDTQNNPSDSIPWSDKAELGYYLTQKLISHK